MEYEGRTVHFIDTPGFNDTYRSESSVFEEIAYWLSKSFETGVFLNGIIYLHSVAEPRFTGSANRNLVLLKTMTGPSNYKAVVLSTTFWSSADTDEQKARERQLVADTSKWGEMKERGSTVYAHSAGRTSALAIVNHIVQKNTKYTLAIQHEMAQAGATLASTSAGRMMGNFWRDDIGQFEGRIQEAKAELDSEAGTFRQKATDGVAKLEDDLAARRRYVAELQRTRDALQRNWETNMAQDTQRLELQIAKTKTALERTRQQRQESETRRDSPSIVQYENEVARLQQRWRDLEQEKGNRLSAYNLLVSFGSMVAGGVSAAISAAPLIATTLGAHAAAGAGMGTVLLCSLM